MRVITACHMESDILSFSEISPYSSFRSSFNMSKKVLQNFTVRPSFPGDLFCKDFTAFSMSLISIFFSQNSLFSSEIVLLIFRFVNLFSVTIPHQTSACYRIEILLHIQFFLVIKTNQIEARIDFHPFLIFSVFSIELTESF